MVTVDRLREVLNYDPDTGVFRWRVSTGDAIRPGQIAGGFNDGGYVKIGIDKRRYLAHRLAWLFVYSAWPKGQIDHFNGCPADNRIANLRDVTCKQNLENVRLRDANTSGYRGVSWDKERGKWLAYITHHHRMLNLGRYDSQEDAARAAKEARDKLFTHHLTPHSA